MLDTLFLPEYSHTRPRDPTKGRRLPIRLRYGVILLAMLGEKSMKRRSKTKFTQIHVSIPVRTLEDLDETLDYNQSRSKIITRLIQNALEGDQVNIGSMTKRQIVINLMNQTDSNTAEYVILQTLLQIFS